MDPIVARLRPCPFCGDSDFEIDYDENDGIRTINCSFCGCSKEFDMLDEYGADAQIEVCIRSWNTRADV